MANFIELEMNWTKRMAEFENRLRAASTPTSPTLVQLSEEFQTFQNVVRSMLNLLQQQVQNCMRAVDAMDMRQRHKVLLFKGVPENSELNVHDDVDEVVKLIRNTLGLAHISDSSIKRCHRLGSQGSDGVRAILVHFHDHQNKSQVWKSKSKLKGTGFTMSEFLTRMRHSVHIKARKHFGIHNVWTLDGTINVKDPSGNRVKIVTEEDFNALVSKFPSTMSDVSPAATGGGSDGSGGRKDGIRAPLQPSSRVLDASRKLPTAADDIKRSRRAAVRK